MRRASENRSGRRVRGLMICLTSWIFLATASRAHAQTTVTSVAPLAFGTMMSGTTTIVAATSAGALAFRISGTLGLSGGFTLTLPSSLTRVGGGGSLPVTYCGTCGIYRLNNTNPVGGTTFNPNNPVVGLSIVIASNLYVWIGGSTSPPLQQAAGTYTGTAVITIAPIL